MVKKRKEDQYTDFSNVVKQNMFLASEEFPEGSYGNATGDDRPVTNKDTPWIEGQKYTSGFAYEDRTLHQHLPRQFPGAHPTHDDPEHDKVPPYEDYTP